MCHQTSTHPFRHSSNDHWPAASKSQEALLLPSKHAANQCTKIGGCSCTIKVPSTALRDASWSAFDSGLQLPAQAATASPAAPTCWVCCRVLKSTGRRGGGGGGGGRRRGGEEGWGRVGSVSSQASCSCCLHIHTKCLSAATKSYSMYYTHLQPFTRGERSRCDIEKEKQGQAWFA